VLRCVHARAVEGQGGQRAVSAWSRHGAAHLVAFAFWEGEVARCHAGAATRRRCARQVVPTGGYAA
jgi:hypothetical protein